MAGRSGPSLKLFIPVGTVIALLLAGVMSYYASAAPDGLVSTAQQLGFVDTENEHARSGSTFAGYTTEGIAGDWLSGAVAGVTGVVLTLVVSGLLFLVVRRRGHSPASDAPAESTPRRSLR